MQVCTKASFFLKQAQGCLLCQSLGAGACVDGDLRTLGFLLWSEMYFHPLTIRESSGPGNSHGRAVSPSWVDIGCLRDLTDTDFLFALPGLRDVG